MKHMNRGLVRHSLLTAFGATALTYAAHMYRPLSWWQWTLYGILELAFFVWVMGIFLLANTCDDLNAAREEHLDALQKLSDAKNEVLESQAALLDNQQLRLDLQERAIANLETQLKLATKTER